MLFLAVFCGFMAEYQLEHKIEGEREKKYMESMVRDLIEDTAKLNRAISNNIYKFNCMDSLIRLLTKEQISSEDELNLYEMYFQAVSIFPFFSNDRTSRQLLTSGNMRLIKNASVADSIIEYYGPKKDYIDEEIKDVTHFTYEANLFSQDIFDFTSIQIRLKPDTTFDYKPQPNKMKLLAKNKELLLKYANKNAACRGLVGAYFRNLMQQRKRAISLITLLKKEYHLK